jgi:hypothetical protein
VVAEEVAEEVVAAATPASPSEESFTVLKQS